MNERSAEKEGEGFFLNDPQKLFDPFPHLKYFRENHPDIFLSASEFVVHFQL